MSTLETAKMKQKKLQWQCRRGMLEIDLVLKRYLSESYLKADENEKTIFEALLIENDQQLFLWLMGKENAPEKYADLVEKLRR